MQGAVLGGALTFGRALMFGRPSPWALAKVLDGKIKDAKNTSAVLPALKLMEDEEDTVQQAQHIILLASQFAEQLRSVLAVLNHQIELDGKTDSESASSTAIVVKVEPDSAKEFPPGSEAWCTQRCVSVKDWHAASVAHQEQIVVLCKEVKAVITRTLSM